MGRPGFSHCLLHVTDLARTRAFYADRLGLEILAEHGGYLRLGGGDGFHIGVEQRLDSEVGAPDIELEMLTTSNPALSAWRLSVSSEKSTRCCGACH